MAAYDSNVTSTNLPSERGSSIPRVISDVVDFSSTTNVSGDTFDVLPVAANSLVLAAGVDVMTADTAGNSGTIAVGDSVDADQYAAAATVAAAGQMTTLDANYAYSSADAIRLTIGTGAINAKVRVWACVISLDGGGTKADTDSQTSTFA